MKKIVERILRRTEHFGAEEFLRDVLEKFSGKIAFSSSMGAEDQVVFDMLYKLDKQAAVFTLDTGRLPKETVELIGETESKYEKSIEIVTPDSEQVERMLSEYGKNLFYESIENRKLIAILYHRWNFVAGIYMHQRYRNMPQKRLASKPQ